MSSMLEELGAPPLLRVGSNADKRFFHNSLIILSGQHLVSISSIIVTAVLAPGDAPNKAAKEPSDEVTVS